MPIIFKKRKPCQDRSVDRIVYEYEYCKTQVRIYSSDTTTPTDPHYTTRILKIYLSVGDNTRKQIG